MRFHIYKRRLLIYFIVVLCSLLNFVVIRSIIYKEGNDHVMSAIATVSSVLRSLKSSSVDCNLQKPKRTDFTTLTIFTSFEYIESKFKANQNALQNWKYLKGVTNFVLFTNCSKSQKLGQSLNYTVLPVLDSAIGGVPVLKSMFLRVLSMFPTSYVMFSNADILYHTDLMDTVKSMDSYVTKHDLTMRPSLIVGKRTNLDIEKEQSWDNLMKMSHEKGTKFVPDALDYFIVNRKFPWEKIPKFVIGRVGYDNWLVAFSRFKNFTVVDASESILAIHQTISGMNFEGFTHDNFSYNRDLIEESLPPFKYAKWGRTVCSDLFTQYNICGQIILSQRTIIPPYCFHHYFSYYIKMLFGL